MFDDLTDLYQQVILDHSRNPRNFRVLDPADRRAEGTNPLCGDQVSLYLRMDGDRVREVGFQGSGCAISKASASLMTEALQGRTADEIRALFDQVHTMVTTGRMPETGDLGKLAVFTGVHKFPARVKCALLPWHAAIAALEGRAEPVSTE
ncbi:MAG: SUF system NifU family Fe-S cluster assembly protein [Verrucomicrobia bacterium]|nr:MAG: SUF system NifU family Fe-S cluster assembly protein [Verrucomicrobiota bacterium]